MKRPHGQLRILLVDQYANLDLAGGDDLDVYVPLGEGLEHGLPVWGCGAGVGAHADADDAGFGDAGVGLRGRQLNLPPRLRG